MIARWQLKAVTAAIKGVIPFQGTLRRAKRRLFPYQTDSAIDRGLLADGLRILSELQAAGSKIEGSVVLEIGSGWHPVIPLLFHLAGARRVWMTDQVHLMDPSLVASAIQLIRRSSTELLANDLRLPDGWPSSLDRGVRDFDSMLEALRLDYSVPFDIKALGNHSIDVLVSRAVLEHIRPNIVASLFSEFRRVLSPSGYMCHVIDNTDHYAHADSSISRINFLQFEDRHWRFLTLSPFFYTNRLRHSDYRKLLLDAGFDIVRENRIIDQRSLEALKEMSLARSFRTKEADDLATATSVFVAKPRTR